MAAAVAREVSLVPWDSGVDAEACSLLSGYALMENRCLLLILNDFTAVIGHWSLVIGY
ncbi:MAG: hypothetical protein F6K31_13535 [Symploca sp. SIO2G7]|nr:hypothetical protein [Symploca sp. SIO2G7]